MSRHFLLLFSVVLLSFIQGNAQEVEIKGKIESLQDHTAIPFAAVYLGEQAATFTDENGNFQFHTSFSGQVTLVIKVLGFEPWTQSITSTNHTIEFGTITLIPTSIQISEVVVTGQSTVIKCSKLGSNSILTPSHLRKTQAISTEELLKQAPGVNVSGDMGLSNRLNVGIRGAYPRRSAQILLMEDGTPIAPAPYLAPEAYYNPPSERMDEIEILKGADVLMAGSNTSFGAINYITRKPPITPQFKLQLTSGQRNYQSQYLSYGGTWKNIGAEIQVLNKKFDGFVDNSGFTIFNTTAKLYSELSTKSSIYLKLNFHKENAKATYSGITPYTFAMDPTQNPFDADDLFTKRIAADLIFNTQPFEALNLSTKIYTHQFSRDWWRQEGTLIKVNDAAAYVGESIFADRYSYILGSNADAEDFVRVGKIANGNESTKARNRVFQVAGIQETIKYSWKENNTKNNSELQLRAHTEKFNNREFTGDSSRFARSGKLVLDEVFDLTSLSAALKHTAEWNRFRISPIVRFEWIKMSQLNLLSSSLITENDGTENFGKVYNEFSQVVPSISLAYQLHKTTNSQLFAGIYRGYLSPATDVGFLVVDDNEVNSSGSNQSPNMKPQISNNLELGIRGSLFHEKIFGGVTAFSNTIQNYYSAGRSTAFESLGEVNISGLEIQAQINLHSFFKWKFHQLVAGVSTSLMQSEILSGRVNDSDLLKAKHNSKSKTEIIDLINESRAAYEIYFDGNSGDSLITRLLTTDDFASIKTLHMNFDDGLLSNKEVPYLPRQIWNFSLSYEWRGFSIIANLNQVASQYTDYMNLQSETNEGALGKLEKFRTVDLTCAYEYKLKTRPQNQITFFITGKNLTDEVYKASRLHRVSSGIMPGGFRQLNAGISIRI
jgi:Fe(3+) dicitrate transport protein